MVESETRLMDFGPLVAQVFFLPSIHWYVPRHNQRRMVK